MTLGALILITAKASVVLNVLALGMSARLTDVKRTRGSGGAGGSIPERVHPTEHAIPTPLGRRAGAV
jgi:hypothetical protein